MPEPPDPSPSTGRTVACSVRADRFAPGVRRVSSECSDRGNGVAPPCVELPGCVRRVGYTSDSHTDPRNPDERGLVHSHATPIPDPPCDYSHAPHQDPGHQRYGRTVAGAHRHRPGTHSRDSTDSHGARAHTDLHPGSSNSDPDLTTNGDAASAHGHQHA